MISLSSLTRKLVTPETNEPENLESTIVIPENTDPKTKRLEDIRQAMAKMSLDSENSVKITQTQTEIQSEKVEGMPVSMPTVEPEPVLQPLEENLETENKSIVSSATGFELVNIFLSEVRDLLEAGNILEALNQEREKLAERMGAKMSEARTLQDSSKTIHDSINALILAQDSGEELASKLKQATIAMEEYDRSFSEQLAKIEADGNKETSEIVSKVSEKKAEIKKILGLIGGNENFEKIKKVIRFAERKSSIKTVSSAVSEFLEDTKSVIGKDLAGTKLLANSNDIVGIFMRIAQVEKNK